MHKPRLASKLHQLPQEPGVYIFKDSRDIAIYVGKAKNLANRVSSYFSQSHTLSPKTKWLVETVTDLELIIVNSEVEALVLESELIKKHRPYFNILHKDDKRYPLLEFTTSEDYPQMRIVRKIGNRKNTYFGPFPNAGALRRTYNWLQKAFQIRTCKDNLEQPFQRPCLDYQIKLCTAPCTRYISKERYRETVQEAIRFLNGHHEGLEQSLTTSMNKAMDTLEYERCAVIRDLLQDIETLKIEQKVIQTDLQDEDYLVIRATSQKLLANILSVRNGKLIGQTQYPLEHPPTESQSEIIEHFIKQHYERYSQPPKTIYTEELPGNQEALSLWLSELSERKVTIKSPKRGTKRKLLELAIHNLEDSLERNTELPISFDPYLALVELTQALEISEQPWRIECIDISNTQGKQSVGSLVCFEGGKPAKKSYRRYRIRSGDTPDDYRMIAETIVRRYGEGKELPDLLIIDGGKGQLSSALEALDSIGLEGSFPVVSLAKKEELLFTPVHPEPIKLSPKSNAFKLVTHMRDEAHRFGLSYHRHLRQVAFKKSLLDEVPGVSNTQAKSLLKHFGSVDKLRSLSIKDITQAAGIGMKTAEKIHAYLHQERDEEQ